MASKIFAENLLDGRVALVTGGGSGLGRASALELVACGADVVICGRRIEPLEETVAMCPEGRASAIACDIREAEAVDAMVDDVLERHGRIDLLLNNAGGQFLAPAETISPKGFRTVMKLNAEGAWITCHAVAEKAMLPAGGGTILNVTLTPHHGLAGMVHSSASRAAVESITADLAREWGPKGVSVIAIAAGQFATETLKTKYPKEVVEAVAMTVPLQRTGTEEEFAWTVALLASPVGAALSGSVLSIDGARDNHFGPWPPGSTAGSGASPPAEERKPKP